MTKFIGLHVHDMYSTLDGLPTPQEYMKRAKELDMSHLAQTNHGTLSGHREFQRAAKETGIIPILGCLMPGQEIHTIHGMKRVEDICVGDEVLTHTGSFKSVLSTMKRHHEGDVYDITLARNGSRTVTVTDEHPVLISDSLGNEKFIRADKIIPGRTNSRRRLKGWNSYAVVPKTARGDATHMRPVTNDVRGNGKFSIVGDDYVGEYRGRQKVKWRGWGKSIEVTERVARFLGLYVAGGSTYKDGRGQCAFAFNVHEGEYVEFVTGVLRDWGIYPDVRTGEDKSTIEVVFCHGPLSRMLGEYCGVGAHNKKVPPFIFSSSQSVIKAFLNGISEGDAKRVFSDHSETHYLKTASPSLAWGLKALVVNIGTYSEVKVAKASLNEKDSLYYSVQWTTKAKFKRSIETESRVLIPIRTAERRFYEGPVYNFEVAGDNSYVSDFSLHNCEAYSTHDINDRRTQAKRQDGTKTYNHITLLAQNEEGLRNLSQLSERAWTEGYYYKPRMSHDDICANSGSLFALSGCLGGALCQAIEQGDMAYANSLMKQYKEAFGDRYYVEVMSSNPVEMNLALLDIAEKHGVNPVATPDCHYSKPEDLWFEEAMLIIQTNPKRISEPEMSKMEKMDALERINYLYPERTMTFEKLELYLKGYEDEATRFARQGIERTDILTNTLEIAGRIGSYPYYEALDILPKPKRPAGEILREQVEAGMKNRGLSGTKYLERLEYELDIIGEKDFDVYFLIVGDMVRWAKNEGIMVGPGRGSCGGSLVCYLLNITDIDPLKFDLHFERFINRNRPRGDFPDIDLDFEDTRRGDVKEYLRQRYEHAASIATFPRFQGKSAIRSASSVMAVPIADVERALKNNESGDERNYLDHFEGSEQGKVFIDRHPEAWELTRFIHGRIRSTGMHPAGIVVSDQSLSQYMPVQTGKEPKRSNRVEYLALDMTEVASVGGIKIDILGLKNLGIIKEALRLIKERNPYNEEIDLLNLSLDNKRTYKMLAEGRTAGVFQMEGAAFTKWIKDTKCDNFQDIVNGSAIARPGPMESIGPDYKAVIKGEKMATWNNDIIRDITKDTLGYVLFQEQISRFMVELAGMNPADAEDVRKSISKKKDASLIAKYKDEFVEGASKHIPRKEAEKYWSDFEKHSGYSLNKIHAVEYSLISYWTAYLKANHTLEYMTALIGAEEDQGVRTGYLLEARRLGIGVDVPHINYAKAKTSIVNGRIMLGLTDIKYIASKAAEKIIAARPFASYEDLIEKAQTKYSGISSRVVDSLDAVGALQFPERPVDVKKAKSNFYEYLGLPVLPHVELTNNAKGKLRKLADYEESTAFVTLAMVKSIVSKATWARAALVDDSASAEAFIDVNSDIETGKFYLMLIAGNSIIKYIPLDEVNDSKSILMDYLNEDMPLPSEGGYRILAFRSRRTKRGDKMGSTVFVDHLGDIYTSLVFPRQYQVALPRLQEGREVRMFIQELKDGGYCVAGFE